MELAQCAEGNPKSCILCCFTITGGLGGLGSAKIILNTLNKYDPINVKKVNFIAKFSSPIQNKPY